MINLTAEIDNKKAKEKLAELKRIAKQTTSSIVTDAERMDTAFRAIGKGDNEPLNEVKRKAKKTADEVVIATKQAETEIKREAEATTEKINQEQEKRKRKAKKTADEIQKAYTTTTNIPAFTVKTDIPKTNPLEGIDTALTHIPDKANKAAGSMSSLNFATQQLVREVPAATMGLHMFFLAISNNLPFFADAIKQVREENKALAASGEPTTSVFKQIIGSLFSWQTALIAGITALTLYGKEIGNWVKGLFKGKDALSTAEKAQKGLNSAIKEQGLGIGDDIIKLKELQRTWLSLGNDMTARNKFILDNKAAFDDLGVSISNVAEADSLFINNTQAFIQALMLRAQASAAQKLAEEKYEEWFRKRQEYVTERDAGVKFADRFQSWASGLDQSTPAGKSTGKIQTADELHQNRISILKGEAKEIKNEADAMFDLSVEYNNNANELLKAAGFMPFGGGAGNGDDKTSEFEERVKTIKQLNNDLAEEVVRTQREMDDAEIAAIKDGVERKRREIQAGYERRAAEIDKYEADIKAAQGGELTPEQKGQISYLRQANTDTLMAGKVLIKAMQDEAAQEATDAMNEHLASYGTFQERILAITSKYERLIANAKTEGERKTLEAERDALLAEYEVATSNWAKEIIDMSTSQLNKMLEELQAEVEAKEEAFAALDSSDSAKAEEYRKTIETLKAKIAQLQAELGMADRKTKDGKWEEAAQIFQGISSNAKEAADAIEGVDEGMASVLRGFADGVSIVGSLVSAINMLSTAGQTLLGVFALISVGIQLVSKIIQINNENVEATRRVTEAVDNYTNALRALNEEQERAAHNTIFGDDSFGEMLTSLEVARERLEGLDELYKKIQYRGDMQSTTFATSGWSKENEELMEKHLRDIEKADAALIADMRSGWQKFTNRAKNIVVADLADFYDANGMLDLEKLKAWYEQYGEYLSDEQKHLVAQLIDGWEVYYGSLESANEYLKGIFGDLGGSMTDALVDAFASGTDAVEAFGEAAEKTLEQLTKDMIRAAFIQPIIEEYEAQIDAMNKENLSPAERVERLMQMINNMQRDVLEQQEYVDAALANAKENAAEQGYDIFDDSTSQSATSKGFQAMSQETGSELNGRFTDIQGQAHRIAEVVEFCRGLQSEQLQQVQSINDTVAKIHNSVDLIATHTRVLGAMNDKLNQIARNTDNW